MDYFKEAFGGFDPQIDMEAALKFAIDLVFADDRIEDLIKVIALESDIGGIEGEPGWIIEHRERQDTQGYETWSKEATFRSFVDPDVYPLAHPEFYCDDQMFRIYVESIAAVYVVRHPEQSRKIDALRAVLSSL